MSAAHKGDNDGDDDDRHDSNAVGAEKECGEEHRGKRQAEYGAGHGPNAYGRTGQHGKSR